MRRMVLGLAMVAVLMVAVPAHATIISNSLSIAEGDKLFNNFTCSVVNNGVGALPTDCSGVNVTPKTDGSGNLGLQFQLAASDSTPGTSGDMLISYDVAVVNSPQHISDIHLTFNGAVTGTGFTSVTETADGIIPITGIIGQVEVTNPPPNFEAQIPLKQLVTKLHVEKDIIWGVHLPGPGTAHISFIDQFVSQTPEPASMTLFGSALVALAALARRRKAQKI